MIEAIAIAVYLIVAICIATAVSLFIREGVEFVGRDAWLDFPPINFAISAIVGLAWPKWLPLVLFSLGMHWFLTLSGKGWIDALYRRLRTKPVASAAKARRYTD